MRLAVVVPTRNRPREVETLLANLAQQTRRPDSVTVVDSSDDCIRETIEALVAASPLPCTYLRHTPPSAAAQRNAGLDAVVEHADLVALIDDDLTLGAEAFANTCRHAEELEPDIIGFGFNPTDEDSRRPYGKLKASKAAEALGLYSGRMGAVARSGWHTRQVQVDKITKVEWLLSGAVAWRAKAIQNLRFDEFFERYSYLEDLEFSLQARQRGRFVILPDATFLHKPAEGGRGSRFWFGRIEIRNRYHIVRKHGLSRWRFWLGAAIRAGMTLAEGLSSRGEMSRLCGNIRELLSIAFSRRNIGGFRD